MLVVDLGGQYSQLIARRVREARVYSELVGHRSPAATLRDRNPAALILSGGPASVYADDAPQVDPGIYELGVPVLGICYGMQLMAQDLGGKVERAAGEFGKTSLTVTGALAAGLPEEQTGWMSHRDSVTAPPEGATVTGGSEATPIAAFEAPERGFYGVQFHPEVVHTPHGQEVLKNFLYGVAGARPAWTPAAVIEEQVERIRAQVGKERVLCALSGGVDSAVAALLVHKAVGDQLTCVYVDHGLMRKDESAQVVETFEGHFHVPLVHVDAADRFLARLEGIRIERELDELKKEAASLKRLLGSPAERRKLAAKEVREDAERFGDKRRTFIEEAERITVSDVQTVLDEPVTVILSRNGFLRSRSGHGIDRSVLSWKEGDGPLAIVETRTVTPVVVFGANGRVFNLRPTDLPGGKGDGVPVASLVETQGTAIVGMLSAAPETAVLLGTSGGNVLHAKIEAFITRQRAGKQFVGVGEGESLLAPAQIPAPAKEVAALSRDGRLLVFPLEEVPELPNGGKGVMALRVHEGEAMVGVQPLGDDIRAVVVGRGDKRNVVTIKRNDIDHYRGSRARTGRVLPGTVKRAEGFE